MNKKVEKNLFVVSTPYHLMVSCCLCGANDVLVCTEDVKIDGVIWNMVEASFLSKIYYVKPLQFYKKNWKELILFRKNMCSIKNQLKKNSFDNIYAFNDVDPVVQWILDNIQHKKNVVIIEEGIGLYRSTIKRKKVIFDKFGKFLFGSSYENIDRIGESSCVNEIMCSFPEHLSEIQQKKIVRNLEKLDYSQIAQNVNIKRIDDSDWFIGQPLVEDGVMSEGEYCNFIKNIVRVNDRMLTIKPHPREDMTKYKILEKELNVKIIWANSIPVELLIDTSSFCKIYTVYSSVVINLSNMKNVECIVLAELYKKKELIPKDIRLMLKGLSICSPNSWSELEKG